MAMAGELLLAFGSNGEEWGGMESGLCYGEGGVKEAFACICYTGPSLPLIGEGGGEEGKWREMANGYAAREARRGGAKATGGRLLQATEE